MTAHRRSAAWCAAALTAGLVAGCTGSSGPATDGDTPSSPPASVTTTPSSPASPSPGSTTSVTPSSTTAGAAGCVAASIQVTHSRGGAAAGTYYLPLVFTNVGAAPCVLRGYPGVSFVDDDGEQLGEPARRLGAEQVHAVTLDSGEQAHANLGIPESANYSDADCRPAKAAGVRVYPPEQTDAQFVASRMQVCTTKEARAFVEPVAAGRHG